MPVSGAHPDAIVIGAGLIGLAATHALGRGGASVVLVGEPRAGAASSAAAGMLAPTVEPLTGPALDFAIASRDRFPDYLRELESQTGVAVPLDRRGILEVARSESRAEALRNAAAAGRALQWLSPSDVATLEPSLAAVLGAVLHPLDGAVDNVVLLEALERAVAAHAHIERIGGAVERIERSGARGLVRLGSGQTITSPVIVLAAGAWSGRIGGLPRPLPVEPSRGQMISVDARALHHVVFDERVYLVPRPDGRTLLGATMERVGFDASTTDDALDALRRRGEETVPALAGAARVAAWAGLRPMSPDGLPIIGADPEWPGLLYATGHSRNGVLMAPLTGDVIASLAQRREPSFDLSPFAIGRFGREDGRTSW